MQYVDDVRRSAKQTLASECARAAERGIDGTTAVAERPVPQAIAQRAEEVEADWVLLGARGHGASVGALLGSVAARTVRACARTTLVVRGPASPLSPGVIVLGDDFSETARVARATAVALARELGARLHVVHALDLGIPLVGAEEIAVPSKVLAQADEEARTRLAAFADSADVEVETSVVSQAPAAALCHAALEAEAGLIVTGSHGYTGLSRLLLGSTAEKTLRHAPCSVLTVKPPNGGGVAA
jgi:nucleotide-binding universal stress UspA family protein